MRTFTSRRLAAFLIGAVLAAPLAAQAPARVRVNLPAYKHAVAIDTIMVVTDHEAPAAKVWAAAARVFYDYKMPTDLRDSVEIGRAHV